jgi:hypothetical protein
MTDLEREKLFAAIMEDRHNLEQKIYSEIESFQEKWRCSIDLSIQTMSLVKKQYEYEAVTRVTVSIDL